MGLSHYVYVYAHFRSATQGYVLRLLKSGKLNIFIYSKLKGRPSSDGEIMLALNMAYTQLFVRPLSPPWSQSKHNCVLNND